MQTLMDVWSICALIVLVPALVGVFWLAFWSMDKCPLCMGKLVQSRQHPNAQLCEKCNYLKVNN